MRLDAGRVRLDSAAVQVSRPSLGHLAAAGVARAEEQELELVGAVVHHADPRRIRVGECLGPNKKALPRDGHTRGPRAQASARSATPSVAPVALRRTCDGSLYAPARLAAALEAVEQPAVQRRARRAEAVIAPWPLLTRLDQTCA